jgi:serine/threonine protein kinase
MSGEVVIFLNKDAVSVDDLLLNEDWKLVEQFARIYRIHVKGNVLDWIVKVHESQKYAKREITALNKLKNINGIPSVLATGLSKRLSFVIISKAPGSDLFEHLNKHGVFSEKEVKNITHQLLLILRIVHSMGIVHKDIKPENIIYDPTDKSITLIDFEGRQTEDYRSPEVIRGQRCNELSDAWAVGITCYMLAWGDVPFENSKQVLHKNAKMRKGWSRQFKDFIGCLLDKDPLSRWSIEDMLNHPWIHS